MFDTVNSQKHLFPFKWKFKAHYLESLVLRRDAAISLPVTQVFLILWIIANGTKFKSFALLSFLLRREILMLETHLLVTVAFSISILQLEVRGSWLCSGQEERKWAGW